MRPPLSLTFRSPQSSKTSKDDMKEKKKETPSSHNHCKSSFFSKCGSSWHLGYYKADRHDKRLKAVSFLNPLNIHFTAELNFKIYQLQMQSQEYSNRISVKIAKWTEKIDVQKKPAMCKPSDFISVLSSWENMKTVCYSSSIQEVDEVWLLSHFTGQPARKVLSHRVTADKKNHQ